jgi:hypothetical protein
MTTCNDSSLVFINVNINNDNLEHSLTKPHRITGSLLAVGLWSRARYFLSIDCRPQTIFSRKCIISEHCYRVQNRGVA